jgi:protein-S-isoprenylcysteine O-methyltransferase Ste14
MAAVTLGKMPEIGFFLLPTLAIEIFVALSFLIRLPAKDSNRSRRARVSAYGGTFLFMLFVMAAHRYAPSWIAPTGSTPARVVGVLLWVTGSVWAAYAVWFLRHSFSIEPEARRLVTSGPYGIARHPVYAGYFVQYAGMWLAYSTLPMGVALGIWIVLMVDRMFHEERVLARAFPEYTEYKHRVGALGPRVFLRRRAKNDLVADLQV